MRSAVSKLEVLEPRSLGQALRMLRDEGPLVPLAGCTDLMVALNAGVLPGRRFLNLWGLEELRRIEARGDVLVLGALATYTQVIRSPLCRRRLPMLVAAAREIGGVQTQNRGTLGGNVANASPAGDTLPVFAAAAATVVLQSAGGTRRVPFASFYTGYRRSVRRSDELIVALEVPRQQGAQVFRKVGTRAAQAISKVVMAAVRPPAPAAPRIALGSVAPTVLRLTRTEQALARGAALDQAEAVLQEEIQPIDDLRSSAAYRRRVAANLLRWFWESSAAG